MLSGQRAFERGTAADSLSAILKDESDELPSTVPAHIRQLIQHCLEKEPANRFQSAKDLASQHHRPVVSRVRNYAVPAWAPDGKSFAFNIQGQVVLQRLDNYSGSTIFENNPVANLPNFSPDGSRVYISSIAENRSVWSVGTAGGTPQLLLKNLGGFLNLDGVAISRDGKSLAPRYRLGSAIWMLEGVAPPHPPLAPALPLTVAVPPPLNSRLKENAPQKLARPTQDLSPQGAKPILSRILQPRNRLPPPCDDNRFPGRHRPQ